MRIVLIEDDPTIAGFVRQGLSEQGYVVDVARDGGEGDHLLTPTPAELIVLDIMLPGRSGIEVCKDLRRRGRVCRRRLRCLGLIT